MAEVTKPLIYQFVRHVPSASAAGNRVGRFQKRSTSRVDDVDTMWRHEIGGIVKMEGWAASNVPVGFVELFLEKKLHGYWG